MRKRRGRRERKENEEKEGKMIGRKKCENFLT
jgi:hypothetical protein